MNDRHIFSGVQKNPRTRFPESPPGDIRDSAGSPAASMGTRDVSSAREFTRPATLGACQGLGKQTPVPSRCPSWEFLVGKKIWRLKHAGTNTCSLRNPCRDTSSGSCLWAGPTEDSGSRSCKLWAVGLDHSCGYSLVASPVTVFIAASSGSRCFILETF